MWEKAKQKAPSKRWGTLIQSPHGEIQEMLKFHQAQVFEDMLDLTETWRSERRRPSVASVETEDDVLPSNRGMNGIGASLKVSGSKSLSPVKR